MSTCHHSSKGFALLTSMLLMVLLAAFSAGMIYVVQSEARLSGMDMEKTQAYYGASAAMEKMVVDLNDLSIQQVPTVANIEALGGVTESPSLPGVEYSEYSFTVPNTAGVPNVEVRTISGGPSHGLMADIIPVTLSVKAKGPSGEVVEMTRDIEFARIPVFQFGVFSDGDLSYFPSAAFPMQGRVHTNSDLFLASGTVDGLIFHSRITAAGEVIRQELANGLSTTTESLAQPVKIPTAPTGCEGTLPACQDLTLTDGSKTAGPASTDNPDWTELSESTYRGIILNGDTGAKALRLPFVSSGEPPIELIRRPPAGEDAASLLGSSRLYNQAQIRVLLSDNLAELPGGMGDQLANVDDYMIAGILYGATDTAFAEDQGSGAPLIDGFLLVQGRQADGTYADVTLEWLNLGIARENTNTAILKFQSLLDDSPLDGVADIPATAANLRTPTNFYPFNLYDSREGEVRDVSGPTTCALGGIMNIVELDVDNLRKWLAGLIGTTGDQVESASQNGYLLYFSDRRGMLPPNVVDPIVGEYGYEDVINPTDAAAMPNPAGVPNGLLDPAEDVNQNGVLDTYGADNLGDGFGAPEGNGDPTFRVGCMTDGPGLHLQARIHRVSGARHALKLVNGTSTLLPSGLPTPGFTVGSENSVYVQGDYNADGAFGDPHVPAAIIADSVTFLSNAWEDWRSFTNPTDPSLPVLSKREATATWFRVAVATGKNIPWANPAWTSNLNDGMDGGVRYLIRSLEQWPSGQAFNYRGSLASLYYSQYGVGVFKCCTAVFSIADLNFSFDTDFLDPTQMPPATPRLQDIVSLGFRQLFTAN